MYTLGINAYHGDSAACLLHDGKLVAAAEEERFRRIKHWAGFPSESIQYCLKEASISIADITDVAINSDPGANWWQKVRYTAKNRPSLSFVVDRLKNKTERARVDRDLAAMGMEDAVGGVRVHHIEHHLAHIASTHLVSPFEDSVAVSIDGFGDFASSATAVCHGTSMEIDRRVMFPHSMGIFYQALTQFLGFPHYGDEYKVMGLAPYGKPTFVEPLRDLVNLENDGTFSLNLDYFRHHSEKVDYEWDGGAPHVGALFKGGPLTEQLGIPERVERSELTDDHRDLAHSIQAIYEEVFFHVLASAHERHGLDTITLAGGCAMNSVANGKVALRSPFKNVYIQSAAGDAGGAIGAAFAASAKSNPQMKRFHMSHAYWGPSFSNDEVEALIKDNGDRIDKEGCVAEFHGDLKTLYDSTSDAIIRGEVIGWFQGRMEWGPRALGNRSILGDPRRTDMKDILNKKIKRRESFRPFAPSILRENVDEWFEQTNDVPFMMQVFQIREPKRKEIPAVTHVDGSGRLQTVSAETNPRYHGLISKYFEKTGVPMLLNTSFNENEPVVCLPQEALETFLRTNMDVLVLGNWMVRRVG